MTEHLGYATRVSTRPGARPHRDRLHRPAGHHRTQRWHSYETCGNRNNVAAYRARRKASSAS
ncbi:CGNR zinc finger domain-containing protein [Streptomyces sp. NPDC001156]